MCGWQGRLSVLFRLYSLKALTQKLHFGVQAHNIYVKNEWQGRGDKATVNVTGA